MFSTSPEQYLYTVVWNIKCSSHTCYHWVVRESNSKIYPISTVASNSPDFNPVANSVCEYCERKCTRHPSLIRTYRRRWRHWRIAAAVTAWSRLAHSVLSRYCSSPRSVMSILNT